MSDTTFIDFQTPAIDADWLNAVNKAVYRALGSGGVAPETALEVLTNLKLLSSAPTEGANQIGYDPAEANTDRLAAFLNNVYARTPAEVAVGVTPTLYYPPQGDIRRYGAVVDGVTPDTAALEDAIDVMGLAGAGGGVVELPNGAAAIDSMVVQPNRVRFRGTNVRSAGLKAVAPFTGSYMLNAVNGVISLFDAGLQDMNLDCNSIAGLGGVLAEAWQENSGMSRVLINKFRTHGIFYRNGFGGASSFVVSETEIFGDPLGAIAGIYLQQVSLVGGFKITVRDSTIAGGGALPASLPRGVHIENDSSFMSNVHFEVCQTGIYLDGVGSHTLILCDGAGGSSLVENVVELAPTFAGTLIMLGCRRNGATNLLKDNRAGGFGTIATDEPFILIDNRPSRYAGAVIANGNLNGVAMTITSAFGVASFTRTGGGPVGDYTIVLNTSVQSANDLVPTLSHNLAGGRITKDVLGVNSFRVRTYDAAGALTDSNQISFQVTRVK
jgi:hypothetical protein